MEIKYHNPIKIINKNGNCTVVSIDKIVVDYYFSDAAARGALAELLYALPFRYSINIKQWSSARIGSYKENFSISFQGGSFWLGAGLITTKTNYGKVRIEANPNKSANHAAFLEILSFLNIHCRKMHTTIKRFDLAVDYPVERSKVRLIKDNRTYCAYMRSANDYTEYLGVRSSTSRAKLYNKSLESKLDFPLTRLEMTLDPTVPYERIHWPHAFVIQTRQVGMNELYLTDTEKFVLGAIVEGYGSLADLGRKTRAKIERALSEYVTWIKVEEGTYNEIIRRLKAFVNYPNIDLGIEVIDPDQPPVPLPEWARDA